MATAMMNTQSKEELEKMVDLAFQCKMKDAILCEGGFCNAVYRVTLEDGRESILKIAGNQPDMIMSYEKGMFQTELWAMELLRSYTTVPVPLVQFATDYYFFMSKVKGQVLNDIYDSLSETERKEAIYTLGSWSRQMSSIKGHNFGYQYNPELQADTNREFILKLMKAAVDDGKRVGTELGFMTWDELWELYQQFADYLDDCTESRFVHWDLWNGNILYENGKIQGLIDFERALYADPLFEHEFSGPLDPNPDFLEGYGKTTFTKSEEIRCILYRIHHVSTMAMEGDFRNYEDTGMRDWSISILKKEVEKLKTFQEEETEHLIRKVEIGDEEALAYIQTESWKAAFQNILSKNDLEFYTNFEKSKEKYDQIVAEFKTRGFLQMVKGKPHGMAFWGAARDEEYSHCAELICIHSLQENWAKGYGSSLMNKVMEEVKNAGYQEIILWVFEKNNRARSFYEKFGFSVKGNKKEFCNATEMMYSLIIE